MPASRRPFLLIVSLLVLLAGLVVGLLLTKNNKYFRPSQAAIIPGPVTVSLVPASRTDAASLTVGETLPIQIVLTPAAGTSPAISGFSFKILYSDNVHAAPLILGQSVNPNQDLVNLGWSYPIARFDTTSTSLTANIGGVFTNGVYVLDQPQVVATLNIQAAAVGTVVLYFDSAQSKVLDNTAGSGQNILINPTAQGIYNIVIAPTPTPIGYCTSNSQCLAGQICVNGSCVLPTPTPTNTPTPTPTNTPTPTPTRTPTPTPTRTPTPTPTNTPVPSPTPTPIGYCTSTNQCTSGQVCVGNYCVNPTPTPTPIGYCISGSNCPPGQFCINNQCVLPTPTPTPPITHLTLKFRLQGTTDLSRSRTGHVIIRNTSRTYTVNPAVATSDNTGLFTGVFEYPASFIPGTYDVLLKTPGFLQKLYTLNTLTGQDQTLILYGTIKQELLAGDTNDNNQITLEDLTAIVNARGSNFAVPITPATQDLDLNGDSQITVVDIALGVLNWTDFVIPGDQ